MRSKSRSVWIILAVILLAVVPLVFVSGEFGGADGAAEEMISEVNPSYTPWFSSLLNPPPETESMLFALQAAIGAGFIGYVIGLFKGKASRKQS